MGFVISYVAMMIFGLPLCALAYMLLEDLMYVKWDDIKKIKITWSDVSEFFCRHKRVIFEGISIILVGFLCWYLWKYSSGISIVVGMILLNIVDALARLID